MFRKLLYLTLGLVGLFFVTAHTLKFITHGWGLELYTAGEGTGLPGEDSASRYLDYFLFILFPISLVLSSSLLFFMNKAKGKWITLTLPVLAVLAVLGCCIVFSLISGSVSAQILSLLFSHLFNGDYLPFLLHKHSEYSSFLISFILSVLFVFYLRKKITGKIALAFLAVFTFLLTTLIAYISEPTFQFYIKVLSPSSNLQGESFVQAFMLYLWGVIIPLATISTIQLLAFFKNFTPQKDVVSGQT